MDKFELKSISNFYIHRCLVKVLIKHFLHLRSRIGWIYVMATIDILISEKGGTCDFGTSDYSRQVSSTYVPI